MKKFLEIVKDRANEFFNGKVSTPAPLEDERIIDIIQQALRKNKGVHVIFSNKSFTGDIVKYDQERRQLIVKNFKRVCPRLFGFLRSRKSVWSPIIFVSPNKRRGLTLSFFVILEQFYLPHLFE